MLLVSMDFNSFDNEILWRLLIKRDYPSIDKLETWKNTYFVTIGMEYFDWCVVNNKLRKNKKLRVINPNYSPGNRMWLWENNIKEIPKDWTWSYDGLKTSIHLHDNLIEEIPEDWSPQVIILSLNNNRITHIPKKWSPRVERLYIHNNPIDRESLRDFWSRNREMEIICDWT